MDYIGYIIAGVVLLLGIVLLVCGYLKAPPDTAYIISGFRKRRILIGKAGWRIPSSSGWTGSPAGDAGGRQDLRGRAYQ